jgi:Protein of unknown function (DUF2796)
MRLLLAAALLAASIAPPVWAGKAHEHGAAKLDIAVEPGRLVISLESPLDGLLGFERAPRSAAEKRAVESMVATLKAADTLFRIDPAAQCSLGLVTLTSAPLKLGDASAAADDGHGDLDADFEFTCKSSPAFVEVGLFKAFPRLARLDVQTATAKGQRKQLLVRPAQRVELAR